MVVDGGIHEGVSEAITALSGAVIATVRQAVAATLGPSQGPPAAPIGDSSEFLDVDMKEFTRPFSLISADLTSGRGVKVP